MSQRERPTTDRVRPATSGTDVIAGPDNARADAERLLRAADDAIARALSADSARFLEATRQSGGQ